MQFQFQFVSSLEKVHCRPDFEPEIPVPPISGAPPVYHAAQGETYACQLMVKCDVNIHLKFRADVPKGVSVSFREVGYIPCDIPGRPLTPDVKYTLPGLYPDPLLPVTDGMRLTFNNWHAVYINFRVSSDCIPGSYVIPFHIEMIQTPGCPWGFPFDLNVTARVKLVVHKAELVPQQLICTNWFYCDCLAKYYRVKPWSKAFWKIAENFWRDMAEHGRNMLYTPLWTPPLNTAKGHERPTVQLLKVYRKGKKFTFNFSVLEEFIDRALKCGITCFEMSHMFTQWGARATPKIVVETTSGEEKMFGWQVASDSPLYKEFLSSLLPELCSFLQKKGLSGKVYFHISDEPSEENLAIYQFASDLVHKYLPTDEFPIMDALSNVEFFQKKLLEIPVPSINHYSAFEKEKLRERWCYYAGNIVDYPGRSLGMPSCLNRIIGVLFYLYRMEGFLHWGHNFWFDEYSLNQDLDPWLCVTAGRAYGGGGSFNVYPGHDGTPVDALHYEIFTIALYDLRLLQTLESKIGREETVKLIHQGLDYRITMDHFPHDAAFLENLHTAVLQKLDQ